MRHRPLASGARAAVALACALAAPIGFARDPLLSFSAETLRDPATARAALGATQAERERLIPIWQARDRGCFERFLVEACRARVAQERREALAELEDIDIRARATLRQQAAIEKNRALAGRGAGAAPVAPQARGGQGRGAQQSD